MTSHRWEQIEELYHLAQDRGEEALAGADPEVRREVERLLEQDSEGGDKLLDQNARELTADGGDAEITPGAQMGPYRIEKLLGRGGMGHVYRATDTRLDRPVAIKICKRAFLDRFRQESRSIAAISHPNVCTLHDVGPGFLVMELVDGETMAVRLKRGKFTLAQTLLFGAQIAEALAVAHARGVVHRDLKPANIMLTKSGVKVLDFGLARSPGDPMLTEPGNVIGTPAYMAPERAEGKEADERADIYALGLMLAEMATGRLSKFPEDLPPELARVIRRCLEADPDDRWQSARDLQWELESIAQAPATASSSPFFFPVWFLVLAAIPVTALAVFALSWLRRTPAPAPLARVNILLPEKSRALSLAVSPDGHFVAVVLVKDGKQQIWIRALDSAEMAPLVGTDGAADPFWSPDSRFLGFFADSRLKKIERTGGPVQILCNALGALGGTWNQNGVILFGGLARPRTVPAAGGTTANLPAHSTTETYPSFLPDGRHYVATRSTGVWLGSIDDPKERQVLPDVSSAQVIAPQPGALVGAVIFTRAGMLTALPFDMRKLEAAGEPYPIASGIASQSFGPGALASASSAGVLAWASGQDRNWECVWRNRQGKVLGNAGPGGSVVMISPDGRRVLGDHLGGGIWALDLATGVNTRLDVNVPGMSPLWSPDGKSIALFGKGGIYRETADGAGESQLLLRTDFLSVPKSWSSDGRYILFDRVDPASGSADVLALPTEGDRRPLAIAATPSNEDQGQFSPDGRWVAYISNESGQSEVYVIPFPPSPASGRWIVSRGGGVQPRWSRDGQELFYISPDWTMMAVPVSTFPVFHAGTPQPLFNTKMVDTGIRTGPISWDISPDGKRFLIITDESQDTSSLNVILNWRPAEQR